MEWTEARLTMLLEPDKPGNLDVIRDYAPECKYRGKPDRVANETSRAVLENMIPEDCQLGAMRWCATPDKATAVEIFGQSFFPDWVGVLE
jgi:hypothetical protein